GRTETEVALKRYKYVGKERDEETGLYYYGARYYAAWIARFVSVDPLQLKYPHYTPYQYAGNKPVSYIDLDGLEEAPSNTEIYRPEAVNTNYTNPTITKYKQIEREIATDEAGRRKIEAFNQRFGSGAVDQIQSNLSSSLSSSFLQNGTTLASHVSTAVSATQVVFNTFSQNWLSSSNGGFFKINSDPILDVSRGRSLMPNGIYNLKNGQSYLGNTNPIRMTDDLQGAAKSLKFPSLGINILSSSLEGYTTYQRTNNLTESIATGTLNFLINLNPFVGTVYSFGNMVVNTDRFKKDQANYYQKLMQEYKYTDGQKYKEAEALYNKYNTQSETNTTPLVIKQSDN
ncbi:MAG TPA: hypothetical protein DF296_10815, partial [Candidatus Margulisbacteria bacterium]|nr:hypothetical protein [Candidatus Margulisiibacteriota bacterium]